MGGMRRLTFSVSPRAMGSCLALGWLLIQPRPAAGLDPGRPVTGYVRRSWGVADGLPQGTITAIAQGPKGYLWLGTQAGLVRFDGERFLVYGSATTRGLESSFVSALARGRDGALWVGTSEGGLSRIENGTFTALGTANGLPSNHVSCLLAGPGNSLWVGTLEGDVARLGRGTVRLLTTAGDSSLGQVRALALDRDGTLWVGGWRGLARLENGRLQPVPLGPGGTSRTVLALRLDTGTGDLWAGTGGSGLYRLRKGRVVEHYGAGDGLAGDTVWAILRDRDGNIWAACAGGLSRINDRGVESLLEADGLPDRTVISLFEDREGDLWVGTISGLLELSDGAAATYTTRDGLPHDLVWSVAPDFAGGLWVLTQAGLCRFRNGTFQGIEIGAPGPRSLIRSISASRAGGLWIGTRDRGVMEVLRHETRRWTTRDGLPPGFVSCVHEDSRGVLWVGTTRGLATVARGRARTYAKLRDTVVLTLAEGSGGEMWVGTHRRGLFVVRNGHVGRPEGAASLTGASIVAIHPDEERPGTVWIGTLERGLFRLQSRRLENCTSRQGLPDDTLLSILEDGRGNLWIGTNHGIVRVAKHDLGDLFAGRASRISPRVYGPSDGVRTPECNGGRPPAAARTADGRLYFPTTGGLVEIDPARLRPNRVPPKVVIESVTADGQRLVGDPARVPAGTRHLVFRYRGISLRCPELVRFRYRLRGFDDGWVDGGRRDQATYTGLPPGEYRFDVAAANADGVWSEAPATRRLVVAPAFWQTPYFHAAWVLLLVAICAGAHHLRMARLRAENAILRERERISAEVHNVVAQTFSGALLKLERAERAAGDAPSEVRELVSGARHLLAESWREIRRTIHGLRPRALERNELCAALAVLVDSLSGTGPDVHIEVSGAPRPLSEDTADGLWRMAQEALANAARHAGARNIWVRLEYDSRVVRLRVADDGRGLVRRGTRTPGAGMGLSSMERQARTRGWAFAIRSAPPGGTEITVEAPLEGNEDTVGSGS